MSKSDGDNNSKILLTTPPDQIRLRIARALTDSFDGVYASPERPGVTNLLQVLAAFENATIEELEKEVGDWSLRNFKERVAETIVSSLRGIQERYQEVQGNKSWLEEVRNEGNERARQIAYERISLIKSVVGLR